MKNKLIRANDLYLSIRDDTDINATHFARFKEHIEEAQPVDAVEVVHGRWLDGNKSFFGKQGNYICSNCHSHTGFVKFNYCPNCGAKMMD